jgi:hypothetical protein
MPSLVWAPELLDDLIVRLMALKESPAPVTTDKGLQAGALGLVGNVVIGLAAVAPAYSLAATLGFVVLAPDYGYTAFGPVGGVFVLY